MPNRRKVFLRAGPTGKVEKNCTVCDKWLPIRCFHLGWPLNVAGRDNRCPPCRSDRRKRDSRT